MNTDEVGNCYSTNFHVNCFNNQNRSVQSQMVVQYRNNWLLSSFDKKMELTDRLTCPQQWFLDSAASRFIASATASSARNPFSPIRQWKFRLQEINSAGLVLIKRNNYTRPPSQDIIGSQPPCRLAFRSCCHGRRLHDTD